MTRIPTLPNRFRAWGFEFDLDVVRSRAYAADKPASMHDWHEWVRVYAQSRNVEFKRPLPIQEVDRLALSVSTWVWSGGGPAHHGMWTQEDRRLGGLTWGRMRRYETRERDAEIVQLVRSGMSRRRVAQLFDLSAMMVSKIVHRDGRV